MEELLRIRNQTLNKLKALAKQKEELQRDKKKAQDEFKNLIYNPFRAVLKEFGTIVFTFMNIKYEMVEIKSLSIKRENITETIEFIDFIMSYNEKEIEELFLTIYNTVLYAIKNAESHLDKERKDVEKLNSIVDMIKIQTNKST